MRTTRVLIYLLAAAALAAAGCAPAGLPGGEEPPTAGALVADSLEALAAQQAPSARFKLTAEAKPKLSGPAALVVGDLLKVEIEGAASASALVAKGKVEDGTGQSFAGEIRAGDGFYLRVGDEWYGAPDAGGAGDGLSFHGPSDAMLERLTAALRAAGNGLVDGEVGGGPEIGGDETWQLEGTLDPDALVEMGRSIGEPLTPEEEASLRREAEKVHVEYAVGRGDRLPRRIALSGSLSVADLPIEVRNGFPLEGLELDLELELSDWGTPVSVEAPERYTSFGELFGSFLGGQGAGFTPPAVPAPAGPPPEIEIPELPPAGAVPPPPEVSPPPQVPPPSAIAPHEAPPPEPRGVSLP